MKVIDVIEELSKHDSGTFLELLDFNHHHFGTCDITGESPVWEMHPDTDEFFYILEGEFKMTLLDGNSPTTLVANSGSVFVVPQGIWHKPAAPKGCKFIYYTPGESVHSDLEDPRT